MQKKAYVIGTCDTKYEELRFVADLIQNQGISTLLVDVGTTRHSLPVDVTAEEVAAYHPFRKDLLINNKGRGDAVSAISEALTEFVLHKKDIGGLIGLGGSGGTALITRAMQSLPVGVPKLMVSTVASGNTSPYVGASDIMMLYSVTDIAGINQISHTVLSNAANALIGMIKYPVTEFKITKPALGMTMFGVTTPCVNYIRQQLEKSYDCLVFHATGTGGRSMEKLIDSGFIKRVMDITLTEICDLIAGGIMSAGEDRMGAIIRNKIPYVGSVGALDMVNFGPRNTVPEKYNNRLFYQHNAQVTLMRTSKEENIQMGRWIANKLNQCEAPVRFLIPEKGVSMLAVEGQVFYDPEADQALFDTLENDIRQSDDRQVIRLPYAINDPEFANAVVKAFEGIN